MPSIELECPNKKCVARTYDESGGLVDAEVWWTETTYDRATGATDCLHPECPTCGEEGEPTGNAE